MSSESDNGYHKATAEPIERVRTATYVPGKHGEEFERTFLAPEIAVQGSLRKTFGNPTPIALGGFLLANTPATVDLMGWGGAGGGVGNAAASTPAYFFFGGMLLLAGAIGEWIIGNTFPATVFFTFSAFWLVFGGTLTPYYAASSSYTNPADFDNSFAFFLIFMCLLCFIYMLCAMRINVILVFILFTFVLAFPCLTVSYRSAAVGETDRSNAFRKAGGAFAFSGSLAAWYLFTSLCFDSVDFPIQLPVGDLSAHMPSREQIRERRAAKSA